MKKNTALSAIFKEEKSSSEDLTKRHLLIKETVDKVIQKAKAASGKEQVRLSCSQITFLVELELSTNVSIEEVYPILHPEYVQEQQDIALILRNIGC